MVNIKQCNWRPRSVLWGTRLQGELNNIGNPPKTHFQPKSRKISFFQLPNRIVILQRARQSHCCALSKISKWLAFQNTLRWRHNDHAGVSNHQPHGCLLNRLFRRKSKKTSKLRVTGLCVGNSPGTGEFSAQMASYAENVSIWWRHHVFGNVQPPVFHHYWPRPGVGVTKPIFSVPLFSESFSIVKTHVSYWASRLYLTGVAAAKLRWHLSNINVIQII